MPRFDLVMQPHVADSFRVRQVQGMFDLPSHAPRAAQVRVAAELPGLDEDWRIGAIVGPSGSGKTTLARAAYGPAVCSPPSWPADRAVIDAFSHLSLKQAVRLLVSVGFSSPPAWLRPHHCLSSGERFRCDLAAALAQAGPLLVVDEFTAAVDRAVARTCSLALARAIRRAAQLGPSNEKSARHTSPAPPPAAPLPNRFVAVTCHDDILPWLQPDWVLDMATGQLARGPLQRPPIILSLYRCTREAWPHFAPHHYLNARLGRGARCYLALWDGQPVAFAALLRAICKNQVWRISRLVVLPQFQGVGIGGALCDALGDLYAARRCRLRITTSHPAMIEHFHHSANWRVVALHAHGRAWGPFRAQRGARAASAGRCVVAAEWLSAR